MAGNSNLFQFVFTTICASANNPKSKFFLPTVLVGIQSGGSSIIPLKEKNWDIGTISGSNGGYIATQIANSYSQLSVPNPNQMAIPLPSNPNPSLNLEDPKGVNMVTINGLENAYVQSFENYNYNQSTGYITADIVMVFNYWTNNPGGLQPGQNVTALSIATPFVLTQNLCIANNSNPSTCIDPTAKPVVVEGVGNFNAGISSLLFTASIQISVMNNRAGLDCQVTNIKLMTSGAGAPQFQHINVKLTNSDPALSGIITSLITSALSSSDASGAIFTQMQDSLNTPGNLSALSGSLTSQLAGFLDAHMSPVVGQLPSDSGQQATNLVDLYLFDRVRYSLNDPSSGWYVQTLLNQYQNPSLNPFKPSDLNLGSFSLNPLPLTLNNVTLSNIVVNGFPNATVPAATMILSPPIMTCVVLLGSLGSGTNATANFSASYSGGQLSFGIGVVVSSVSLTAAIQPSGPMVSELNVAFNSITFGIPQPSAMVITINDSGDPLAPFVQKVLNSADVQNIIANAINAQLAQHLGAIGSEVTSLIQNLVSQVVN